MIQLMQHQIKKPDYYYFVIDISSDILKNVKIIIGLIRKEDGVNEQKDINNNFNLE